MRRKRVALCDESSGDDDSDADENTVAAKEEYRQSLAKTELKAFRHDKSAPVPCQVFDVLKWWCVNEHKYPVVVELARSMLAIPASQIERERIFSLSGLVTQHLRNKMGVDNMAATVLSPRFLIFLQRWSVS
jgi:hypothetical protein